MARGCHIGQHGSGTLRQRENEFFRIPESLGPGGKSEYMCMFSGRFTRHLNIISINAFEDDILTKIFSSIADWHFGRGFDVMFLR